MLCDRWAWFRLLTVTRARYASPEGESTHQRAARICSEQAAAETSKTCLAYHSGSQRRVHQKGATMFVLSVDLRIKRENVESFIAKAIENAADSRKEPGCRQFDVLVDPKDRTQVMLYEVYADEKAFDAHQQSAHFKKYLAETGAPAALRPPPRPGLPHV